MMDTNSTTTVNNDNANKKRKLSGDSTLSYPFVNVGDNLFVDNTILFACKSMKDIALRVIKSHDKNKTGVNKNSVLAMGEITWNRFDTVDGWPDLFIHDAHLLQHNDVMFLASFHSPEVVFEQLSAIYAISRYAARSLKVIIPFFPTGTMERVSKYGEIATAATFARMLSAIPMTATGPAQIVFFDIHALQEQFYFNDQVIIHLRSCMHLLLSKIEHTLDANKTVIVFPDDGAEKRFGTKFNMFPNVICHKIRNGDKRIVKIRDGLEFVKGNHCIIVDDLVKSGGTLIKCAEQLNKAGAKTINAFVTHAVFPGESYRKFFPSKDHDFSFTKFWITDSIPVVATKLINQKPFEVLSIDELIPFLRKNYKDENPNKYD